MKPGSWSSIALIYFYSILCAASISKLIPLEGDLERAFGATPAGVGLAISLIAVSSVFAATIGGAMIDRIGLRRAMVGTSVFLVLCNLGGFAARSLLALDLARLAEGVEFIGIIVAAPALIMATTTGRRRVQAMTLWSTYTPAGVTLGLLLGAPFAGTSVWRWMFLVHGALFAGAALLGGLLPEVPRAPEQDGPRGRATWLAECGEVYREAGPWKLSVSNAALISIGLGTSTVMPAYLARAHHISIAASSSVLAASNAAMIVGGLGAGIALTRGKKPLSVYGGLAAAGMASALLLYDPLVSFPWAVAALLVWLGSTGAGVAVLMALLPQVARDPEKGGATMGLVGQVMAVTNLVTPPLYLGLLAKGNWLSFVALISGGWVVSLAFLPARRQRAAAPAEEASVSISRE